MAYQAVPPSAQAILPSSSPAGSASPWGEHGMKVVRWRGAAWKEAAWQGAATPMPLPRAAEGSGREGPLMPPRTSGATSSCMLVVSTYFSAKVLLLVQSTASSCSPPLINTLTMGPCSIHRGRKDQTCFEHHDITGTRCFSPLLHDGFQEVFCAFEQAIVGADVASVHQASRHVKLHP